MKKKMMTLQQNAQPETTCELCSWASLASERLASERVSPPSASERPARNRIFERMAEASLHDFHLI